MNSLQDDSQDGEFVWSSALQGYILSSFFYGYVITQIPFGILAKKYGSNESKLGGCATRDVGEK